MRNPTDVTSAPPSVTWSREERHDTARNRLLVGAEAAVRRQGFAADGAAVVLTGLCEDCRAMERERSSRPSRVGRATGR